MAIDCGVSTWGFSFALVNEPYNLIHVGAPCSSWLPPFSKDPGTLPIRGFLSLLLELFEILNSLFLAMLNYGILTFPTS